MATTNGTMLNLLIPISLFCTLWVLYSLYDILYVEKADSIDPNSFEAKLHAYLNLLDHKWKHLCMSLTCFSMFDYTMFKYIAIYRWGHNIVPTSFKVIWKILLATHGLAAIILLILTLYQLFKKRNDDDVIPSTHATLAIFLVILLIIGCSWD